MTETRLILPGITTTSGSDWKSKIKEVKELQLKEVALFLTCLEKKEREEIYSLIEKAGIKSVPFVHLRDDMELDEIDALVERFNVQAFNIHSPRVAKALEYHRSKHKDKIYVENRLVPMLEEDIKRFAGICLDFAHLENKKLLNRKGYELDVEMLEKYPIGANHISAIKKDLQQNKAGRFHHDHHHLDNMSELDYLKNYPKEYFAPFISVELDNTIKEQLKVIDYIKKIIK